MNVLLRFLQRNATVLDGKGRDKRFSDARKPLTDKALASRYGIERDGSNRISRPVP